MDVESATRRHRQMDPWSLSTAKGKLSLTKCAFTMQPAGTSVELPSVHCYSAFFSSFLCGGFGAGPDAQVLKNVSFQADSNQAEGFFWTMQLDERNRQTRWMTRHGRWWLWSVSLAVARPAVCLCCSGSMTARHSCGRWVVDLVICI